MKKAKLSLNKESLRYLSAGQVETIGGGTLDGDIGDIINPIDLTDLGAGNKFTVPPTRCLTEVSLNICPSVSCITLCGQDVCSGEISRCGCQLSDWCMP